MKRLARLGVLMTQIPWVMALGFGFPATASDHDWNVPIRSGSLTPDWRSLPPGSGCDKGNCGTGAEAPGGRLSWNFLPAKFGAQIVEFKPQEIVGGVPQRPKRGLAFESSGMRSMLNDIGFDATRCQAPVVRMHTKLRGGFQSTAWVYARCSLR